MYSGDGSLLAGQAAVVTGAAGGIGRAITAALAAAGARVLAADIARERLAATAEQLDVNWAAVDVTSKDSVANLREQARSQLGAVDILVSNAGVARSHSVLSLDVAEWDRTFAVNTRGVFLCAQAFGADMAERGAGCIVNMSSVSGRQGDATLAHYSASKFAVIGFTQALARELGPYGVRANALCPGTVDTEMGCKLAEEWGMTLFELAERDQIIKRPVTADEVGSAVVFLAAMPIITGQALNVDGGLVLS
jgi:meso-butanediol dehydrogenase / (S,S)-butanediol dehydrogenase / diacetyl reductase